MVNSAADVSAVPDDERSEDKSNAGYRLNEDVHTGASRVLQRNSNASTGHCSFVLCVTFDDLLLSLVLFHKLFWTLEISQLHVPLGGAPCSSAVAVRNSNLNA